MNNILLNSVEANTDGELTLSSGGAKTLVVWGDDFGGGTVTLEASPDNGTTFITLELPDGNPATFSANRVVRIDAIGVGLPIRATLTGATTPVNVNARLY